MLRPRKTFVLLIILSTISTKNIFSEDIFCSLGCYRGCIWLPPWGEKVFNISSVFRIGIASFSMPNYNVKYGFDLVFDIPLTKIYLFNFSFGMGTLLGSKEIERNRREIAMALPILFRNAISVNIVNSIFNGRKISPKFQEQIYIGGGISWIKFGYGTNLGFKGVYYVLHDEWTPMMEIGFTLLHNTSQRIKLLCDFGYRFLQKKVNEPTHHFSLLSFSGFFIRVGFHSSIRITI